MKARSPLPKMLDTINATSLQRRMALILLRVNGIENAIEYVEGLEKAK